MPRLLLVLSGPTAVGKTATAVSIARQFSTIILSADSRQFYKEIPIGTAQPSAEELKAVPHFFVADRSISDPLDAGSYSKEARKLLEEKFQEHEIIILAGGSGLYSDAVLNGFDELPQNDESIRQSLKETLREKGISALQDELQQLDPVYFAQVDQHNPSRLMRAIEVCRISGKPYSDLRSGKKDDPGFDVIKIGLEIPRGELYERINQRVGQMLAAGLEAEAKAVYPFRQAGALQTVGYKELFDYFDGKTDFARAVELIKQHTRNYAKRQMTWWRRDPEIQWFHPNDLAGIIRAIEKRI